MVLPADRHPRAERTGGGFTISFRIRENLPCVHGPRAGLFARGLSLVAPNAFSALLAVEQMNNNSAFSFHDRFKKHEPPSAEAAVMV